jgi:2-polyprenyl-3-methyl-5-hydroxy-6-metoxy-1,4-benzoquinol methylase
LWIDISENKIRFAEHMYPHVRFQKMGCEDIISSWKTFDLLICTEVLEHQEHPEKLLSSFDKISDKYILLSVPHEPYRSRSNLIRGKYLSTWGTTPEHKQKYTKSSFQKILNTTLPWREINVQSKWFRLIAIAKKL